MAEFQWKVWKDKLFFSKCLWISNFFKCYIHTTYNTAAKHSAHVLLVKLNIKNAQEVQTNRKCRFKSAAFNQDRNRILKVLTNEKRGGLTRSSFKLFTLWFSFTSMQAPSCERPKTNQQTLFLSFSINNCFPTSDEKLLAVFELILGDFYHCKTTIR